MYSSSSQFFLMCCISTNGSVKTSKLFVCTDSFAYFKRSFLSFFLFFFFLLNGASIYCINRKQHRTSASTKNETYKSCSHANPFEIRIIQNNSIKPTKLINRKTTGGEPTPPENFQQQRTQKMSGKGRLIRRLVY